MRKIAIFGAPCNNTNLGCMALTYSLIHLLEELAAEENDAFQYYIFEGNPSKKATERVEDELNLQRGKLVSFPLFYIKDLMRFVAFAPHNVKLLHALKECDVAIDMTQGDSFSDIYGEERFNLSSNIKQLVEGVGIKLILGPQTYGPYQKEKNANKAGKILQSARCIMARDRLSGELVKKISGKNAIVTTDLAFQLPWKQQKFNDDVKKVGVNVSALLVKNKIESTQTRFELKTDYDQYLTELLKWLCDNQYEIHLIPHVSEDYVAAQKFHSIFPQTVLEEMFETPMAAKSLISGMDIFIGARMHATIAAVSSGVATIPLAYSPKFQSLFELIGYNHVVDMQTMSTTCALEMTKNLVLSENSVANDAVHSAEVCEGYKIITKNCLRTAIFKK